MESSRRPASSATASGPTSATRQLSEIVSEIARGLIDLGLEPGERVALLCTTRVEWTFADFGITSAGGVVVPIYPTNSPEECAWVAGNSESRFAIAENASQVAKLVAVRDELPKLEAIISIEPGRGRDLAGRAARARPRAGRRRGRRSASPASSPRTRTRSSTRRARPARPRAACCQPGQLPLGHPDVRGDRRHRGGRAGLPLPAARALLRAADPAAGRGPRRPADLLERRPARRSCRT